MEGNGCGFEQVSFVTHELFVTFHICYSSTQIKANEEITVKLLKIVRVEQALFLRNRKPYEKFEIHVCDTFFSELKI